MSEQHPQRIEEPDIHLVFGLLRDQASQAARGLQSRVEGELRRVGRAEDTDPGLMRVALSALLQTTNFIFGALGAVDPSPRTDHDDA